GSRRARAARGGLPSTPGVPSRARRVGAAPLPGSHAAPQADRLRSQSVARGRRARDGDLVPRVGWRMSERPIPNAVPHLAGNEWRYLKECLDTNWVSSVGPFVERFERETAAAVGAAHAVTAVRGTAALHGAVRQAGVGLGHEVVLVARPFIGH